MIEESTRLQQRYATAAEPLRERLGGLRAAVAAAAGADGLQAPGPLAAGVDVVGGSIPHGSRVLGPWVYAHGVGFLLFLLFACCTLCVWRCGVQGLVSGGGAACCLRLHSRDVVWVCCWGGRGGCCGRLWVCSFLLLSFSIFVVFEQPGGCCGQLCTLMRACMTGACCHTLARDLWQGAQCSKTFD